MNKFSVAVVAIFMGLLVKVDSLSGMALARLVEMDQELLVLAQERDRRALNPEELYNFEFLRNEIPAEAARLEGIFPGAFTPELRAFLADLDARHPRVHAPRPAGVAPRVHMANVPGRGFVPPLPLPPVPPVRPVPPVAPVPPAEGFVNWVKDHPVSSSLIVVGGVTLIFVTVDVIVNGKKSCIGRLFYKNNESSSEEDEQLHDELIVGSAEAEMAS